METNVTNKLAVLLREAVSMHGSDHNLPDDINSKANIYEDYGIDSLTAVGFFIEIQRTFKFRIPEEKAQQFRSLSEISAYLIEQFKLIESKV